MQLEAHSQVSPGFSQPLLLTFRGSLWEPSCWTKVELLSKRRKELKMLKVQDFCKTNSVTVSLTVEAAVLRADHKSRQDHIPSSLIFWNRYTDMETWAFGEVWFPLQGDCGTLKGKCSPCPVCAPDKPQVLKPHRQSQPISLPPLSTKIWNFSRCPQEKKECEILFLFCQ